MNNKQCLHFSRHCSINRTLRFVISPPLTPIPALSLFLLFVQWPSVSQKRKYRTLIPLIQGLGPNALNAPTIKRAPWSLVSHAQILTIILRLITGCTPAPKRVWSYPLCFHIHLCPTRLTHHYFKSFLPITLNKAKWPWPICHKKKISSCFFCHLCFSPRACKNAQWVF